MSRARTSRPAPLILGQSGIRSAYTTGRGSIMMRVAPHVEEGRGDRRSIVLTAIPYQVGKNGLVEKIAEAAKDKRIEGVSDIRDESNRDGVRIVIDLKRDATPEVVLNQLWRHTPAQSSFPANMLAIRGGRPETLTLRDIIESFVQLPRGGHHPPLEVRAAEGPRARPHPARPGRRGHQPRRGGEADPRLGQPGRGAREAARARMARRRRSAPYIALVEAVEPQAKRRELQAVRSAGEGDPRASPAPPDRARPRRDRRRARRACHEHRRAARNPRQPRPPLRGDARGVRRGRSRVRDPAHVRDRRRPPTASRTRI